MEHNMMVYGQVSAPDDCPIMQLKLDDNGNQPVPNSIGTMHLSEHSEIYIPVNIINATIPEKPKRKRKQSFGSPPTAKPPKQCLYQLDETDNTLSDDFRKKIAKAKRSKGYRIGQQTRENEYARKLAICVKMLLAKGSTLDEITDAWDTMNPTFTDTSDNLRNFSTFVLAIRGDQKLSYFAV